MTDEMKDKIQKLIDYIEKEFPDGCISEPTCKPDCPLYCYDCDGADFRHHMCRMLLCMTGKKRDNT